MAAMDCSFWIIAPLLSAGNSFGVTTAEVRSNQGPSYTYSITPQTKSVIQTLSKGLLWFEAVLKQPSKQFHLFLKILTKVGYRPKADISKKYFRDVV